MEFKHPPTRDYIKPKSLKITSPNYNHNFPVFVMLRKESGRKSQQKANKTRKYTNKKILNSFNWTFKVLIERLFCQFAYNLEL